MKVFRIGKKFPLSCLRMEVRQQNSPDSDMPEDLGDEGMAEGVDTIARHTFNKEKQSQTMSELSYDQLNQSSQ